ncbi:MAG: molybdopterin molybdotransferase MoeA [Deltaproteobacteria bacterium]|nr:molybdopterin molybdotransferase MoeA [Deltaproteobacteria bacterium]
MGEFLNLKSVAQAREILREFEPVDVETVNLQEADGRVCATDIRAREDMPSSARAAMDGYAVRAKDTFGASDAVPSFLRVRGSVPMGDVFPDSVGAGEAVGISTGGVVPLGADAVVMVEYTSEGEGDELEIHKGVAPGENVIRPAEDIRKEDVVIPAGRRLRPQDVGALAAFGIPQLTVYRRPRVAILSTGNEIVAPTETPRPGQVRDVNQYALAAQAKKDGACVLLGGVARDDAAEIAARCAGLLEQSDMLILSGGSSVGVRDLTASVLEGLGAEILFHGISVRPGKPTILSRVGKKPVLGMPGVPVSALVIYDMFVRPLTWRMGGERDREEWPARVKARMTRRVPSVAGREDYLRVRLISRNGETWAEPIMGGSAIISTMLKANGYVVIPSHAEGVAEGEDVEVLRFCG